MTFRSASGLRSAAALANRRHAAIRRARLPLEDFARARTHGLGGCAVARAVRSASAASSSFAAMRNRIVRAQALGDRGEIGVMRAHHNRHAELRRLKRIVSARRNQAAAHERHAGQRIHRRQFADACPAARFPRAATAICRLRLPLRPPDPPSSPTSREAPRPRANRSGWRGARTITSCGFGSEELRPRVKQCRFLTLERAARNNEPQPAARRLQHARASASSRGTHIELEIPCDRNSLRRATKREQALGIRLALRQHAAQPCPATAPQIAAAFR